MSSIDGYVCANDPRRIEPLTGDGGACKSVNADAGACVSGQAQRLLQLQDEAHAAVLSLETTLDTVRHTMAVRGVLPAHAIEASTVETPPTAPATADSGPPRSVRPATRAAMVAVGIVALAIPALALSWNGSGAVPGRKAADVAPISLTVTEAGQTQATGERDRASAPLPASITAAPVTADDPGASLYAARYAKAPASEKACLARAIYYEARGETLEGQIAVAQVVLNRARSKKWPDTICKVVNQGIERGEKCQFSFACFTHLSPPSGALWEQAQTVAEQAITGKAWLRELTDATHYHTTSVAPVWRTSLTPLTTIGSHVFYREGNGLQEASLEPGMYEAATAVPPPAAPARNPAAAARAAAIKARARNSAPLRAAPARPSPANGTDWKTRILGVQ